LSPSTAPTGTAQRTPRARTIMITSSSCPGSPGTSSPGTAAPALPPHARGPRRGRSSCACYSCRARCVRSARSRSPRASSKPWNAVGAGRAAARRVAARARAARHGGARLAAAVAGPMRLGCRAMMPRPQRRFAGAGQPRSLRTLAAGAGSGRRARRGAAQPRRNASGGPARKARLQLRGRLCTRRGHFGIDAQLAAFGYAFTWAEQQSSAAARLVPLGHMATQRVLSRVLDDIPTG
jgi:hypothetical protein